jgi:hypothetical protein
MVTHLILVQEVLVRILLGQLKMMKMLRKNKITEKELTKISIEEVLAQYKGSGTDDVPCKRLTLSVVIEEATVPNVRFIVYDKNQTPIMSSRNVYEAVGRYNVLEDGKPEVIGADEEKQVV